MVVVIALLTPGGVGRGGAGGEGVRLIAAGRWHGADRSLRHGLRRGATRNRSSSRDGAVPGSPVVSRRPRGPSAVHGRPLGAVSRDQDKCYASRAARGGRPRGRLRSAAPRPSPPALGPGEAAAAGGASAKGGPLAVTTRLMGAVMTDRAAAVCVLSCPRQHVTRFCAEWRCRLGAERVRKNSAAV